MENVVVIDLRRLILNSDIYIERLLRAKPELEGRVTYDPTKRRALREYIYNRFWNILNETTKYKFDELEEDLYISEMFKDWDPKCWYRTGEGDLIIDDQKSFDFLGGWVEELDADINTIITKERLNVGWQLCQFDISQTTLTVELYGDWRAQKWCEENDIEYKF